MPGTYTPNYQLYMPVVNEIGWAVLVNGNWSAIDNALVAIESALALSTELDIVSANTDYTIGANADVVLVDASGGNRVITLPPVALSNKRMLRIKKTDASANTVTVDGNASEAIDGELTRMLGFQYEAATLICDGAAWHVFA